MRREGLLLVERFIARAKPPVSIAATEIRARYGGFDGIAWPGETVRDITLVDGLAPLSEMPRLAAYAAGFEDIDLIYIAIGASSSPTDFRFRGYDVGYFASEYSHFSVVLNEIVCGVMPELVKHAAALNDWLLFDSPVDARAAVETRHQIEAIAGDAIEDCPEDIDTVMIFGVLR